MKRLLLIALLLLLPLSVAVAQQTPQLTEVQALRVENLQLKTQLAKALARIAELEQLQNQLALSQELQQLLAEVEAAYPGFTLKQGELVKKDP